MFFKKKKKKITRDLPKRSSIRSSYGTFLIFVEGSSFDKVVKGEMMHRCWRDFFLSWLFFLFFFFLITFLFLFFPFFFPLQIWIIEQEGLIGWACFYKVAIRSMHFSIWNGTIKILTVNKYSVKYSHTCVCIISYGLLLSGNYATAWSRQLDR